MANRSLDELQTETALAGLPLFEFARKAEKNNLVPFPSARRADLVRRFARRAAEDPRSAWIKIEALGDEIAKGLMKIGVAPERAAADAAMLKDRLADEVERLWREVGANG